MKHSFHSSKQQRPACSAFPVNSDLNWATSSSSDFIRLHTYKEKYSKPCSQEPWHLVERPAYLSGCVLRSLLLDVGTIMTVLGFTTCSRYLVRLRRVWVDCRDLLLLFTDDSLGQRELGGLQRSMLHSCFRQSLPSWSRQSDGSMAVGFY